MSYPTLSVNRESTAYHEAGHIVVAATQNLTLSQEGIHLDRFGQGFASYDQPDSASERTIVPILAGPIAQHIFCPACVNYRTDREMARRIIREMYPDEESQHAALLMLSTLTTEVVERCWPAIQAVANAVWNKPWTPMPDGVKNQTWLLGSDERWLGGIEIVRILEEFQIMARVSDNRVAEGRG